MIEVRSARGETLVELIVAMAVLSLAAVAILTGFQLAIKASDIHRKQTTGGAYVRSYAEALEKYIAASNSNYVKVPNCSNPSTTYAASTPLSGGTVLFTPPTNFKATVTNVQPVSAAGALLACGATDTGVQAVTLNVASTDGRASESLTVMVRLACVAAGASPCS